LVKLKSIGICHLSTLDKDDLSNYRPMSMKFCQLY